MTPKQAPDIAEIPEETALSRTLANTETLQLAEIHTLDAFYTPIEERFERLTRLAKRVLRAPVVAITVVTHQTQWFKSVLGWHVSEMPLNESLCQPVVERGKPLLIGDLARNPRLATHSLVIKPPAFRYYCGVPLRNAHGTVIGTLCAMGFKPRKIADDIAQSLFDIAALAERELLTVALHNAQSALLSKLSVARRQALIDPLTKTWNRRGGMMLIEEALAQAKKNDKSVTVLAIDIDNFKAVNDTYGHAAGDNVLRKVARELLACMRKGDGVCRCGGDEFFVVVSALSSDDAIRIAHRIKANIQRGAVVVKGGQKTRISISIGYKHVDVVETATAEELLTAADSELYDSKMRKQLRVDVG